ncbi:MAG: hypothetical protein FK734_02860 [Asgard group archaeon]|nr:hypothetical protein [Asgard group archaeon]
MPFYELPNLGTADVSKKLKIRLNISAEDFFKRYPKETASLSLDSKNMIRLAINENLEPDLRGRQIEISKFFEDIIEKLSGQGFGTEELAEQALAEELKRVELNIGEDDEGQPQVTIDKDTGEVEGELIIGDVKMESKLVPIKLFEKIEMFYEHDGTPSGLENVFTGKMTIKNESEKDRLWDIDVTLGNISKTSLEKDSIQLQELNPTEEKDFEYSFEARVEPELSVEEFISTAGNPEIESYSLAIKAENEIFIRIKLTNKADEELTKIALYKIIPEDFSNVQLLNQSVGTAEIKDKDGQQVAFWEIEKLDAGEDATLDLRVQVYVENKDIKLRTGKFAVKYMKPHSLSDLEIQKFDAYTNNSYNIIANEMDEEPNTYECKFIFENKSEFKIRLVNADVYKADDPSVKFIDIDPNEIPVIPAGGTWESKTWTYATDDGDYPEFKTKIEFFTIADHQIVSKIKMNYADVELAVAALDGTIGYDVAKLPSFKITPFNLSGKIANTGGANLNEVKLVEQIQSEFLPPRPEDVQVLLNGRAIDVPSDAITIEPEDQDPTREHTITVVLENLKDTDYGPLKPGDEIEFRYPITAFKPTKETLYQANAILSANTYPAGKPIEIKADPIEILVVHIRKNLAKGKDIQALDTEGEYEITLSIKNMGEGELTNYRLKEKIPVGIQLFDVSDEATVSEKDDAQTLTWKFDTITPGETVQVSYKIRPSEDAKVSDTQKEE